MDLWLANWHFSRKLYFMLRIWGLGLGILLCIIVTSWIKTRPWNKHAPTPVWNKSSVSVFLQWQLAHQTCLPQFLFGHYRNKRLGSAEMGQHCDRFFVFALYKYSYLLITLTITHICNVYCYIWLGDKECDTFCCSAGQRHMSGGHHVASTWQHFTRKVLHCGVVKIWSKLCGLVILVYSSVISLPVNGEFTTININNCNETIASVKCLTTIAYGIN